MAVDGKGPALTPSHREDHRERPATPRLIAARRAGLLAGVVVALLVSLVLLGGRLGAPAGEEHRADPAATPAPTPTLEPPVTAAGAQASFDTLVASIGGEVALSWAPVGGGAVQELGDITDTEAWSTLKVPIALANVAKDDGSSPAAVTTLMNQAITYSDNDSAKALWDRLGDDAQARAAVTAVLREAGDDTTRAGLDDSGERDAFGMTAWAVDDAARFASGMPCLDDADQVLNLMGHIDTEQRWGLGQVHGARFKGGWGISPHGYLMRQVGVVPVKGGAVGVALAVRPADGSHATGARNATRVAAWFVDQLGEADGGSCPRS